MCGICYIEISMNERIVKHNIQYVKSFIYSIKHMICYGEYDHFFVDYSCIMKIDVINYSIYVCSISEVCI